MLGLNFGGHLTGVSLCKKGFQHVLGDVSLSFCVLGAEHDTTKFVDKFRAVLNTFIEIREIDSKYA